MAFDAAFREEAANAANAPTCTGPWNNTTTKMTILVWTARSWSGSELLSGAPRYPTASFPAADRLLSMSEFEVHNGRLSERLNSGAVTVMMGITSGAANTMLSIDVRFRK